MRSDPLQLSFKWPLFPRDSFREEFIIGAWHPSAELQVSWSHPPQSVEISGIRRRNWFMLSSRSPFQSCGDGLAHAASGPLAPAPNREAMEAVAFQGYLLEPPIHSWSNPKDIIDYWLGEHDRHNGVFAAIRVTRGGDQLEFISDAFGLKPLYYREFAGGLLFSTNSRFLVTENDQLDGIASRILMHSQSVYGNRSLTKGLYRVPPGTVIKFRDGGETERKWFSLSSLPTGNRPLTLAGIQEAEDAFQNAMNRCLRLQVAGHLLPLSGGDDSRRILAALHSRGVPFSALTVRTLHKEYRDVDGHWAAVMATELGFKHQVVELPPPSEFARLDHTRRLLMDAHGCEHTWFLAMHDHMPEHSCLVFDGTGGDVFGNTGFGIERLHTTKDSEKLSMIGEMVIDHVFDRLLSELWWPSADSVRAELLAFLKDLPDGRNKSDLAFLFTRCRSGPAMCAQRLIPAGHVTVYPYFDLDHAYVTLGFDPVEKLPPKTLQARCLAEFWPRYYAFPGSRRIPSESKPGSPKPDQERWLACFKQLQTETRFPFRCGLGTLLTSRAYANSVLIAAHTDSSHRARWWLEPLLTLLARRINERACWTVTSDQIDGNSAVAGAVYSTKGLDIS